LNKSKYFLVIPIHNIDLYKQVRELIRSEQFLFNLHEEAIEKVNQIEVEDRAEFVTNSRWSNFANWNVRLTTSANDIFLRSIGKSIFWKKFIRFMAVRYRFQRKPLLQKRHFSGVFFKWDKSGNLVIDLKSLNQLKLVDPYRLSLIFVGISFDMSVEILTSKNSYHKVFFLDYNQISTLDTNLLDNSNLIIDYPTKFVLSQKLGYLPADTDTINTKFLKNIQKSGTLFLVDEIPQIDHTNIYFTFWEELIHTKWPMRLVFCALNRTILRASVVEYDYESSQFVHLKDLSNLDILAMLELLSSFELVIDSMHSQFFPLEKLCSLLEIEFRDLKSRSTASNTDMWFRLLSFFLQIKVLNESNHSPEAELSSAFNRQKWGDSVALFIHEHSNED